MFKFFTQKKRADMSDPKILLNKEVFTAAKQKKNVTRAARESAEDQKKVVEKYRALIGYGQVLQD